MVLRLLSGIWCQFLKRGQGWGEGVECREKVTGLFLNVFPLTFFIYFILRLYLCIFREGERKGEREGDKHQCVVASHALPIEDLACNPGMCPDWELSQWPFGSQASTQSTEPHQPGLLSLFKFIYIFREREREGEGEGETHWYERETLIGCL